MLLPVAALAGVAEADPLALGAVVAAVALSGAAYLGQRWWLARRRR